MTGICFRYSARAQRYRRTVVLTAMFLLGAGGGFVWTVAVGSAQEAEDSQGQAQRIVGVWDVAVTLRDCQTGNPVGAVRARNMHELWIDRQVERVEYSGWRRHRSVPRHRQQAASLEVQVVKPEDLFDHDPFADFFK